MREGAPGRFDGLPGIEIGADGGDTGGLGSPAKPEKAMQHVRSAMMCFNLCMVT